MLNVKDLTTEELEEHRISGLEGVLFNKLPRKGCELIAEDGYKFYDLRNSNNYDENGNLYEDDKKILCVYMTCLCETKEQVVQHVKSVKIN